MINSQLGAAQLLAELLDSIGTRAAQHPFTLQPAAAEPTTQPAAGAGPPVYNFIRAQTVADV